MIKIAFLFNGEKMAYLINAVGIIDYWPAKKPKPVMNKIIMNVLKLEMKNIKQRIIEYA